MFDIPLLINLFFFLQAIHSGTQLLNLLSEWGWAELKKCVVYKKKHLAAATYLATSRPSVFIE